MLLEIITPEKELYKNEIDEVSVPTENGEITVLPHHIGLLTRLVAGEITIHKDSKIETIAVTGGFMEVNKDHVSILADYAIKATDIEIAEVEAAKKRAEQLMKDKTNEKDFKVAEIELIKAITQLKVADRYKKRR